MDAAFGGHATAPAERQSSQEAARRAKAAFFALCRSYLCPCVVWKWKKEGNRYASASAHAGVGVGVGASPAAATAVSWVKEQNIPIIVTLDVEFYGCKGEPFSKDKNCTVCKWKFKFLLTASISKIQI